MNPIPNLTILENQFDFKEYCCLKSIEIFDESEAQGIYPSRYRLVGLLIADTIYTPCYLIKKIGEIALYIINDLLNASDVGEVLFKAFCLSENCEYLVLFLLFPLFTSFLRVSATGIGILFPQLALKGWKIAEGGEALFYRLWSQKTFGNGYFNEENLRNAFAEIHPSNAIYYLGEAEALIWSQAIDFEYDADQIDLDIRQQFTGLLEAIHAADKNCFRDLLSYDQKIRSLNHHTPLYDPFPASPKVCKILTNVEKEFPEPELKKNLILEISQLRKENQNVPEDVWLLKQKPWGESQENSLLKFDEWFMEEIPKIEKISQIKHVFEHFCLNLEYSLISKKLPPTLQEIEPTIIQLKNLFSRRLDFGRAFFLTPVHGLDAYNFTRI